MGETPRHKVMRTELDTELDPNRFIDIDGLPRGASVMGICATIDGEGMPLHECCYRVLGGSLSVAFATDRFIYEDPGTIHHVVIIVVYDEPDETT